MREYIITIAAAAVAASVADILSPEEWGKYIKIIIGFLILSVVIAPITKFKDTEILPPTEEFEISDIPLKDEVSEELRKGIEQDIERRVLEEFATEVHAVAEIDIDEQHRIRGVKAIKLTAWKNPDGMLDRLKNVYGCDRIELKFE